MQFISQIDEITHFLSNHSAATERVYLLVSECQSPQGTRYVMVRMPLQTDLVQL